MKLLTSSSASFLLMTALLFVSTGCDLFSENSKPSPATQETSPFGIFSETTPDRLTPDVDSFIGTFDGGSASFHEFDVDRTVKKEGDLSMKSTVSVNGSGYAGWYISWGNEDQLENNDHTIDMSAFAGGGLTFSVKSPIMLEVGVRSGNVVAGRETSKVLLNNYSSFTADDTWQQMCIPLSKVAGPAPKADLSKIKILFVTAVNESSGGTNGAAETFWIDDIRWTKASCP